MRNKKKIGFITGGIFLLAIIAVSWLFNGIMSDKWNIQRNAVKTAYEKTVLTKAVMVDRFVGDKAYTVIQGEDKIGHPLFVWVSEDEIRYEMAANGVSAEQINNNVLKSHPKAEVIRTLPGIQNGKVVWEVFYKLIPEGASREQYFYDYYTFKDGQWIDTWRMSIQ